jgi:(p)ppGpp synthase/HD superfamily hydrolase
MGDLEPFAERILSRLLQRLARHLRQADLDRVREAASWANLAHGGQVRDDGTPYVRHPLRVAAILAGEVRVLTPVTLQVAVLHDVLEDCADIDAHQLEAAFGGEVAGNVIDLTKPAAGTHSSGHRKKLYFSALAAAGEVPKTVKLADKLDNVRDAVTCPDARKRMRTYADARELFDLLCPTLSDRRVAACFASLLEAALPPEVLTRHDGEIMV